MMNNKEPSMPTDQKLKGMYATETSKKEMMEILKRVEQNDDLSFDSETAESNSDSEDEDLQKRLEGIDLNNADSVWEHLSEKEQNEFMEMIKSGKTADIIPEWDPWWRCSASLQERVIAEGNNPSSFMKNCPRIIEAPLLSSIMSVAPSPCVPFNILNVLSGYVWMTHLFNGEHHDNCTDAAEALFSLCPVLSKGVNYESAQTAIVATNIEAQNYPWLKETDSFHEKVQRDLRKILTGPSSSLVSFYVSAALSDIMAVLISCKQSLFHKNCDPMGVFAATVGAQAGSVSVHFATKESMAKAAKKMEFYLSYVKEYPDQICRS